MKKITALFLVLIMVSACAFEDEATDIRPIAVVPKVDLGVEADAQADVGDVDAHEDLAVGIGVPGVRHELVLRDARGEVLARGVSAQFEAQDPGSALRPKWRTVVMSLVGEEGTVWALAMAPMMYDLSTGRAVPWAHDRRAPVYINGDCIEGNIIMPVSNTGAFSAAIYSDMRGSTIARLMRGGTTLMPADNLSLVTLDEAGRCVSLPANQYPYKTLPHTYTDAMPDSMRLLPGLAPYTVSMEEAAAR